MRTGSEFSMDIDGHEDILNDSFSFSELSLDKIEHFSHFSPFTCRLTSGLKP
jgi:hypothetical protein